MSFGVNGFERVAADYLDSYGGVATVAWDRRNTVLYCNTAFVELLQTETAPLGKSIQEFLRFPDCPGLDFGILSVPRQLSAILKTDQTDYRCDSTVFPLDDGFIAFCIRPVLLQSGIVEKMSRMNLELTNMSWEGQKKSRKIEKINEQLQREIVERKLVEDALRSSEVRYHSLMEQSSEALAVVDLQTQEVLEVNRRFTELFGYSLPADAPLHVKNLVVDSQTNLDRTYNVLLRQQRTVLTELRVFRHKNGTEVPVERAGTVINFEGREIYLASMRDMTEERRRQSELTRDAELACRVQRELLAELPDSPLVALRSIYHPSNVVSGDSYHLEWQNQGKLLRGFLVDVSGHGLGTAIQTSSFNVLLREASIAQLPLIEQVQWLNMRAAKYFADGAYAAMLGFEMDFSMGELRYVGAGITQFYANGRKIATPGMFVGMWDKAEFESGVITVVEGDCLYFLTDGFTDALARQEYANFWSQGGRNFDADVAALEQLAEAGTLRDDATAVCVKVIGEIAPTKERECND